MCIKYCNWLLKNVIVSAYFSYVGVQMFTYINLICFSFSFFLFPLFCFVLCSLLSIFLLHIHITSNCKTLCTGEFSHPGIPTAPRARDWGRSPGLWVCPHMASPLSAEPSLGWQWCVFSIQKTTGPCCLQGRRDSHSQPPWQHVRMHTEPRRHRLGRETLLCARAVLQYILLKYIGQTLFVLVLCTFSHTDIGGIVCALPFYMQILGGDFIRGGGGGGVFVGFLPKKKLY